MRIPRDLLILLSWAITRQFLTVDIIRRASLSTGSMGMGLFRRVGHKHRGPTELRRVLNRVMMAFSKKCGQKTSFAEMIETC